MSQPHAERPTSTSTGRLPLKLAYWFIWLAVTACLLFIHRNDAKYHIWVLKVQGAVDILTCPLYAVAICGAALAVWRGLRRHADFPVQSGQWMLVWIGVYAFAHETRKLALKALVPPDLSAFSPEWLKQRVWIFEYGTEALVFGLALSVVCMALLYLRGSVAWQSVFLCIAISQLLEIAVCLKCAADFSNSTIGWHLAHAAQLLLVVATGVSFAIGITELVFRMRRDAFHWLGIASGVAPVMHTLVFWSPLPFVFQE